jgi:GTP cyclohydrolase IA
MSQMDTTTHPIHGLRKTSTEEAQRAVEVLLRLVGEDPQRDGLCDTPDRVVKALLEMTAGYDESPVEILSTTFAEHSDELIVLRGIDFHSICEHHLLPFQGVAHVGYLPGRVVGISKLARLVHCFARRLQIQERMTQQVARAVETHLEARGVGVVIAAHHLCMGCRGVKLPATQLVTSAMLGTLRSNADTRPSFCGFAARREEGAT